MPTGNLEITSDHQVMGENSVLRMGIGNERARPTEVPTGLGRVFVVGQGQFAQFQMQTGTLFASEGGRVEALPVERFSLYSVALCQATYLVQEREDRFIRY